MNKNSRELKMFEDLRSQAEELIGRFEEEERSYSHNLTDLIHELNVHQKELEIQNEELREAQDELSTLYKEYSDLYEFAPNGYITINPKGIISRINLTGTKMLGVERSILQRSAFSSFVDKESLDTYYATLKQAQETGYPQKKEIKLIYSSTSTKQKNNKVWVQFDVVADLTKNEELRQFRLTMTDVSQRVQAENEAKQLLQEKNQLLREVHHRIKNHMLSISAILSYQISQSVNPEVVNSLEETKKRFEVMLNIYTTLFTNEEVGRISIQPFMQRLIINIQDAHIQHRSIEVIHKIENIEISAKQAFPIGIIVNEALSNAIKYAFNKGDGEIIVVIKELKNSYIELRIKDNGVGISQEKIKVKEFGFGLNLINTYAEQYDGNMTIKSAVGEGTEIIVRIELQN